MKGYSYYNGQYSLYNAEAITTCDRSIFFGDGVYDVMIGRKGKIYQKNLHLTRLRGNAKFLKIPFKKSDAELDTIFSKLMDYTNFDFFILYIQVSRYAEFRTHDGGDNDRSNLLITLTPYELPDSQSVYSLICEKDIRHRLCNIKTLNLLPAVLASKKAKSRGCNEAVFEYNGFITECAHSNIFILKDRTVFTHPKSNNILPGIMRRNTIEFCKENKIQIVEKPFSKVEMFGADEIFITSTTRFAKRVSMIDGKACGMSNSTLTQRLIDYLYRDFFVKTE